MLAAFYEGNQKITIGKCIEMEPQKGEVKIKIAYCGICGTDLHIFHGKMDKRVDIPQIMGHECSGEIVEIGEDVEGFSIGDRIVVRPLDYCGKCPACLAGHQHICHNLKFLGIDTQGAFQSYWTVPSTTLHKVPDDVCLKHAAMVEPLAVACHDVRMGNVKRGEHVVVMGGGPIGMLVALVAKSKGANVLISEINDYRISLAQKLGIDVINPAKDDIVEYVEKRTNGAGADVVLEASGAEIVAESMTNILATRGRIVLVAIYSQPTKINLHRFFWRELRLFGARVYENIDYENALSLASNKQIPFDELITDIAPLSELQDTLEKMGNDQKAMKTLIDCR